MKDIDTLAIKLLKIISLMWLIILIMWVIIALKK